MIIPKRQIHDVRVLPRLRFADERGAVLRMLRSDEPEFAGFGEIYFSTIFPGVVKAWKCHQEMTLNLFAVAGRVRFVLFDDRAGSPTHGTLQETVLDESEGRLLIIPPLLWTGFRGEGTSTAMIANCSNIPHEPTEVQRRPEHDPYFNYDWV